MNRGEAVAHYILNNCQGTLGNSAKVAAKNNPVYAGTVSGGTCGADGLSLDGVDDYASVGDPTEGGLDFGDEEDFTLTGWFYRDTATTDDVIVAKRESDEAASVGYLLYVDDSMDQLVFEVSDGTDEYALASTTIFASAGWHHFAVVWDDDDEEEGARIYIVSTVRMLSDHQNRTTPVGEDCPLVKCQHQLAWMPDTRVIWHLPLELQTRSVRVPAYCVRCS